MYNNQNNNMNNNNEWEQGYSFVRVLHASPNAPAVDIYVDDSPFLEDLAYTELSDYYMVPVGDYRITVYPSGETMNPVIESDVSVPEFSIVTLAAIGTLPDISILPVTEPMNETMNGDNDTCVRFVHLSPNAPSVDIRLPDGTVVFGNVAYREFTDYECVPEDTYTFEVVPAGTDDVVLRVPDVELSRQMLYTVYAVGLVGDEPELEVLLSSEPRY